MMRMIKNVCTKYNVPLQKTPQCSWLSGKQGGEVKSGDACKGEAGRGGWR